MYFDGVPFIKIIIKKQKKKSKEKNVRRVPHLPRYGTEWVPTHVTTRYQLRVSENVLTHARARDTDVKETVLVWVLADCLKQRE